MTETEWLNWLIQLLYWLYVYLPVFYGMYCLYHIARRTETPAAWRAFVPGLNLVLLVRIGGRSLLWLLLLLVPVLQVMVWALLWMFVSERRGQPEWWGIAILAPVINLIFLHHLAFEGHESAND